MADVIAGGVDLAMTEFLEANRFTVTGQSAAALKYPNAEGTLVTLVPVPADIEAEDPTTPPYTQLSTIAQLQEQCYYGEIEGGWNVGEIWFEHIVVRPFSFDFGNVLTTQNETVVVYSSYRSQNITLTTITNNLGAGTTLTNPPALPRVFEPQTGITINLQVLSDGDAVMNDTIDFTFNVGSASVKIEGQRVVLFPFRPQAPLIETLEFMTDVLEHIDGSEQRVANRKTPRQTFQFNMTTDGDDRRYMENLLYDFHQRLFGVPVWTEPSTLTAAASATNTSITVDQTSLGDYRVGGFAVIFTDRRTFDVQKITTITATTLTFESGLVNDYAVGAQVYPMRLCYASGRARGTRAAVNDDTIQFDFQVADNDTGTSYASTASFNSLNSKVLLDGGNVTERRMSQELNRRLDLFDAETGAFSQSSAWTRDRRSSVKGFTMRTRQEIVNTKKLLHALRGKQVSFYLPTFFDELVPTLTLANGSQNLTIQNVGFSRFAQQQGPSRNIIRVVETDGTVHIRTVQSSSEVDTNSETLVVDTAWPNDITVAEVDRIEYVELVRADTDKFEIKHQDANGTATLFFPVKAVFE